mgnify:CR=1 FL=1
MGVMSMRDVDLLGVATLVREATARPPEGADGRARLLERAAELGVAPEAAADLLALWTPHGWRSPEVLLADVADSLMWDLESPALA